MPLSNMSTRRFLIWRLFKKKESEIIILELELKFATSIYSNQWFE